MYAFIFSEMDISHQSRFWVKKNVINYWKIMKGFW